MPVLRRALRLSQGAWPQLPLNAGGPCASQFDGASALLSRACSQRRASLSKSPSKRRGLLLGSPAVNDQLQAAAAAHRAVPARPAPPPPARAASGPAASEPHCFRLGSPALCQHHDTHRHATSSSCGGTGVSRARCSRTRAASQAQPRPGPERRRRAGRCRSGAERSSQCSRGGGSSSQCSRGGGSSSRSSRGGRGGGSSSCGSDATWQEEEEWAGAAGPLTGASIRWGEMLPTCIAEGMVHIAVDGLFPTYYVGACRC